MEFRGENCDIDFTWNLHSLPLTHPLPHLPNAHTQEDRRLRELVQTHSQTTEAWKIISEVFVDRNTKQVRHVTADDDGSSD